MTDGLEIEWLSCSYTSQVAKLHIEGISTGFISSLGVGFVTALYEAIAEDENSFGFVAVEDDKVLGFVAFSTNLSKLYKHIVFKKGLKFGFILAKKMLSIQNVKKIWSNIFYPKRMKQMNLPDAELLSIVVSPEGRGKGIAKQLIEKGFSECANRGIDRVKVLVAADNKPANKLYQKCGFELHSQIFSHAVKSNIYVIMASSF
jgi:ribosomal protein S18 acetylase RimI-like enzyme